MPILSQLYDFRGLPLKQIDDETAPDGVRVAAKAGRGRGKTGGHITLSDVADACGVSTATVSRVLNNHVHVTDEVRARVARTVAELGYYPNTAARSLVTHKSMTIAALVPTIEYPGFAKTVQAMQRRLASSGYTMLQATSDYDLDREFEQIKMLTTRGVDGLMLIGARHDEELYGWLNARNIPYVNSWIADSRGNGASVGFDNRLAAAQVAEYLLDMGHEKISMIVGNTEANDRAAERLEGVRSQLESRGLQLHSRRLMERPFKIGEGRVAFREIMEQPDRPTAIICSNDMLAFGAISEAHRMNIAVPDQVSIVGFDDDDFAQELNPPLTTMRVEAAQIGVLAAEHLLDRLAGRPAPERVEIPVHVIVRESASPPRK